MQPLVQNEFKEESRLKHSFNLYNLFRTFEVFCDVTLVSSDIEFVAHKIILICRSTYFHDMLGDEIDRVDMGMIDAESLELLIDYMYSFEITLTERNVMGVTIGASILHLNALKMECCKFLAEQLNPDNCVPICTLAQKLECEELLKITQDYINEYYAQLDPERFLNFSCYELSEFFSKTNIPIRDEERRYETLVRWVKYDLQTRRKYLKHLMKHVQINLLPRQYLVNVANELLFEHNMDVKNSIITTLLHMDSYPSANPPLTLLVMGGYTLESETSFETYNFNEHSWSKMHLMPIKRQGTGVVYVNGKIFIIGRTDITKPVNSVTEYDYLNNKWLSTVRANTSRTHHNVVALGDCIYMVGGRNILGSLNSVEKYNTITGRFSLAAEMICKRCCPGLCVYDNCIYVVGGFAEKGTPLRSVECYNPRKDVWKTAASLKTPRCGPAVAVMDDFIYAIGGDDGVNCLNTCEVFCKGYNKWTPITPMKFPRKFASAVVANNMLYVIGGSDGGNDLTSIEVYNAKRNLWTVMDKQMKIGRSHHGCVVVPEKPE